MTSSKDKSTTSTDAVHAGIERARAHHTLTPSIVLRNGVRVPASRTHMEKEKLGI